MTGVIHNADEAHHFSSYINGTLENRYMNASIRHITLKKDKQFLFEVQLNWLAGTRGILSAKDAEGTLQVATPSEFGGEGKPWTPEHLFLSSISSCYMTTYLVFAKKLGFEISHFDCNAIGQIEIIEGKYKFTNINLFPKVYITGEELREKARIAMEKTNKYCLITNSVNAAIFYHSEILIDPHPKAAPAETEKHLINSVGGSSYD